MASFSFLFFWVNFCEVPKVAIIHRKL
jgi:hypothetical protein